MTQSTERTALETLAPTSIVVVGAGQIGRPLAARLASLGSRVTLVSRRRPSEVPAGVDHAICDGSDAEALAAIVRRTDATAVVMAANPESYDADVWRAQLFPLQRGIVAACERTSSRLVALECLYMHGPSERLTPSSPLDATSRKGIVRIELTNELAEAASRGLDVVRFRAPDFYGRSLTASVIGEDAIRRAEAGELGFSLGDADLEHAFTHRDDVVDGLARLAMLPTGTELRGEVFLAPSIHASQRSLLDAFARRARGDGARARILAVPYVVFRVLSWFTKFGREILEMGYIWSQPYRVDDSGFRVRFGAAPRTLEQALEA